MDRIFLTCFKFYAKLEYKYECIGSSNLLQQYISDGHQQWMLREKNKKVANLVLMLFDLTDSTSFFSPLDHGLKLCEVPSYFWFLTCFPSHSCFWTSVLC